MKKFRKALLSLVLVLGMVVTMLQGSIPASADEAENPMRALWLRPKEKTAAQVEAAVEKIADAGINTIFLETVFNGYTIFPVDYDYTYQNPMYNGFDVLQAYIDECHERGIQVHSWVESFFIGMAWENNGGPVYAAKKDWLLTDTNGNNYEDTMYGPMYFLNPARPECREWIVGLYEILVENYDIDGLQLDYVRYPERSNSIDYGFDDFTISAFEDEYGVSPYDAPSKFIQFKQDQVTEFVKACAFNLKGIDPGLILSLSVYPFYSDGKSLFMQSAQLWMEEGYGDLVVPMAYYENQVSSITNSTINIAGGSEKNVVIGISTQSGFAINSLVNQANAVLNKGAGVAFFEYESFFNGGYADALAEDTLSDTQFNIDREVYKSSVDLEIPERPENPEEPEDPVKPEEPTIPENAAMVTFANGYDWTAQVNQIYMFATDDATASISSLTGQDAATYAWFHTVVLEENEDGNYEVKAAGFGKDTGAIAETLGAGKVIIMAHDTTSYVDSFNWLKALAVGDVVAMNSAWDEVNGTYGDVEVYFSIADEEPEVPVEPEQPTHENVIHYAAVEPGCHYNGSIEYWFCPDCEGFWTDEALTQVTNSKSVILPATGEGNLVHMEAVAPGCHYVGNIEYWVCYDCEQVWQDEALTQLTNIKNVIVPATGSENLEHVEAVAATCYTEGNVEYWFCPDCEGFWTDEACTQLTNSKNVIVPMIEHGNKLHYDAVAPGCHYNGSIEYWYCPDCEGFWTDEACTQVTNSKSVILPATGEGNLVHMEAVAPGCHYVGNIEYWVCYDCEQVWQDEALTQLTNIKNVIVPATGSENLEHVEAVAATCYTEGNVEYWFCPDCEGFWTDEACTQLTNSKNVIVPMIGHANKVHMEAVEPGCHYVGHVEHWYCPDCETVWADEELTQITNHKNVIVPELGGEVIHVEAKAPTATEDGNIEYWYCEDCEQVWQDEARTQLTNFKNVILPATGETPADPETPTDKDDAEKPADKAPETGDGMPVALMVSMLLAAVACVTLGIKKRNA